MALNVGFNLATLISLITIIGLLVFGIKKTIFQSQAVKWVAMVIMGIFLIVGLSGIGLWTSLSELAITDADEDDDLVEDIVDEDVEAPSVTDTAADGRYIIETFKVQFKEEYSNAYNTVGNTTDGDIKIYDEVTDPTEPTANPIITVNVTSGVGTDTQKLITTEKNYRVVFDGGLGWYSEDWGVIKFPVGNYQKQTGTFKFEGNGRVISAIAEIDDFFNETQTDGDVNGQTTCQGDEELNCTATSDDVISYSEHAGDGDFYIQPEISVSGANKKIRDAVMCFEFDTSTPPEGDEVSSISYQHVSGTDFLAQQNIGSELVDYWANEGCIKLANTIKGGTSSKIKLTITVSEANLDTDDDWYLYIDDLGEIRGKDVVNNRGTQYDRLKFDASN